MDVWDQGGKPMYDLWMDHQRPSVVTDFTLQPCTLHGSHFHMTESNTLTSLSVTVGDNKITEQWCILLNCITQLSW